MIHIIARGGPAFHAHILKLPMLEGFCAFVCTYMFLCSHVILSIHVCTGKVTIKLENLPEHQEHETWHQLMPENSTTSKGTLKLITFLNVSIAITYYTQVYFGFAYLHSMRLSSRLENILHLKRLASQLAVNYLIIFLNQTPTGCRLVHLVS